jgi:protein O-GlcNAc transferase
MTNTQQALREAQQHQQAGRLPEARRAFLDVLKAPSQPPIVLAQIGLSLFRLGYPADAERAFQTAVSLFPDDSAAHHNLGSFYSMRHQHVRAELSYRRATVLDPDDPDTRCALGTCLSSQGHMAEAAAQFRLAVEARPDHPTYGKRLGTALFKLHCHEEAIEVLRGVLQSNPLDTCCVISMAMRRR